MGTALSSVLGSSGSPSEDSPSSSESSRVSTFHSAPSWQLHFNSVKETPKLFMEPFLKEMAAKFTEVEFVKLDVDELPDVAQEFGVQAMPTFVLVKQGKEVDRVVGAQKNELEKKVEKNKG
ncbi:hypothetical protein Goshw_010469 [Gossypium schwendimanii]|uniref:Thioredoxin domain-containing protein n=1 Tax=Gossypium schwendimanii TaxID=34291 RepID=A0A7J9LG12_GOSSC|nr:hypothetical protein [Gossypium schwendimanii]